MWWSSYTTSLDVTRFSLLGAEAGKRRTSHLNNVSPLELTRFRGHGLLCS